jgi:hypothetical protein
MWYLSAAVPLVLEVLLIVHVFRTGRDRFWIYIIIFVPLAGGIAYLLIEVLPDLVRGRGAARLKTGVTRALDPGRVIREHQAALALSPTVHNRSALAEAWMEAGEPAKAVDLYAECLTGIYRSDRFLMSRLARALHAAGYHTRARQVLDEIIRIHGPIRDDRELLCMASTLDSCGETAHADQVYRAAVQKASGLEARYRYVAFLHKNGRRPEAERELAVMAQGFDLMPRFARRDQRAWIEAARKELE